MRIPMTLKNTSTFSISAVNHAIYCDTNTANLVSDFTGRSTPLSTSAIWGTSGLIGGPVSDYRTSAIWGTSGISGPTATGMRSLMGVPVNDDLADLVPALSRGNLAVIAHLAAQRRNDLAAFAYQC